MNTLTPEQLADLLLKITDHAKKQALSFIQGNPSISGSPTEEVEWFYDELRNSEHPDWPLTLSTEHMDKAVDEYHAGFKSAFQPVWGDSFGGTEAVRPSASGLAASGADVPREPHLYAAQVYDTLKPFREYVERLEEGPHKQAMVKARNLILYGVESLDSVETDPAPNHSALLIEARDVLQATQPYISKTMYLSQKVHTTLSKLQSIKL
jgi:hypothetical protein